MKKEFPVKQIISAAGGGRKVSKSLGISEAAVSNWVKKDKIPPERILHIAKMTRWIFTPHMIDDAIYPNPHDALPLSRTPLGKRLKEFSASLNHRK